MEKRFSECENFVKRKMEKISFRSFEEKDFPAVQELHSVSFSELARGHYTEDQMSANEQMFRDPGYMPELLKCKITLAVVGNKIVGSAGWCLQDPKTARIRKVFVSPKFANRGIGGLLMQQVENEIRLSGIKDVCVRASMNAISFYEKSGFHKIRQEAMLLDGGIDSPVLIMQKNMERDIAKC